MCANANSDLKVQCVQFGLIYDIHVGKKTSHTVHAFIKKYSHHTVKLIWFSYIS